MRQRPVTCKHPEAGQESQGIVLPTVLPGVLVNTSEAVNQDFTQMRLQRWTGESWDQFSEVLDAKSE
jgi:hypothetical protein